MKRRDFVMACAASAAASAPFAAPLTIAADARPHRYTRARLMDAKGEPLSAKAIPVARNLIFHYPYASTPCFLLNLGKPANVRARLRTADQSPYEWEGGVGPEGSIVAYSAICAHKMTYPTRDISFISYRAEKTPGSKFASVIHCCSEHSQYDPAQGGRVLAGPAPQPLAAILLEHDAASDGLYAVGTLGGELFEQFFEKYAFKLAMELGPAARQPVGERCVVQELDNYCRQQVKC